MARPSLYTPELIATIAGRLAKGEPLAAICRDDEMPHPSTVRDWMAADESVNRLIARAREDGFDEIASQCVDIAEDGTRDYDMGEKGFVVNQDHIQRSKLRIWTRLELLKKWDPKRYGDKVQHADADGNTLPVPNFTILPVTPKA